MIAAHRARHRLVWLALAIALPLLLWLAVRARPERPLNRELPAGVDDFADDTRAGARP